VKGVGQGGDEVLPKPRLQVGDQVRLYYRGKKKPFRCGKVVAIYERFFIVHFGHYQESFLWIDTMLGEIKVVQFGKRTTSRVG
jgi:uncharacterized protein Veg